MNFNQRDALRVAALSFYALLSLFPTLVLLLLAANLLWGESVVQEQVERLALRLFPGDVPTMVISGVESALDQGPSLNIVALAGLLWAASSFFSNLTIALDTIFDLPTKRRPIWRNRVVATLTIFILALLLAATVVITYALRSFTQTSLETPGVIMRPVSLLVPLLLYTLILALLFRYVPRARTQWRAIIPGAVLGSIGWELSRTVFALYLENLTNYSVVYGSLGAVIALLVWTYISLAILLLSAEVSAALDDLMQKHGAP
ncbi:MAG: YihY/virulence factor BrkB family protein [Anaerolineaceae bacterium]|nr:YihY/virulence factor BrkB family protein [Anaerolineaceae bacterium]